MFFQDSGDMNASFLRILRLLRLLRSLKALSKIRSVCPTNALHRSDYSSAARSMVTRPVAALFHPRQVRLLVRGLRHGLPDTVNFLLLFSLFLYIFALAGKQLFVAKLHSPGEAAPPITYDTLIGAFVATLQVPQQRYPPLPFRTRPPRFTR
jgi:hypothetical protein